MVPLVLLVLTVKFEKATKRQQWNGRHGESWVISKDGVGVGGEFKAWERVKGEPERLSLRGWHHLSTSEVHIGGAI